jgi:hypothetical protein
MVVYRWRGAFGMLAVPLAVANIGLVGLNIGFSPDLWWSLWTLSVSAIPVIGAGLVAFGVTTRDRALAISGALVTLLLAVVALFEPSVIWTVVSEALFVVALFITLRKLMARSWSLLFAHVVLAVVLNILMLAQNLLQDPDTIWFTYVLAATTIPLAIHGLVRWGMLGFADATWEQAKIAQLTERMRAFADADEVQRRIFWTARIQRTFWSHLFLSAVVAIDLAIINILSGTDQPWAIWPVGVWLVVLGVHAGYAFAPNRWLGANVMFWLGTGAGLIAIDTWEPAARWWPWPVAAYGVLVAAHIGWVILKPRWYGALIGFCLASIPFFILANGMTGDPVWWYWPALAAVALMVIATPIAFMLVQRMARWESGKMTSRPRNP